MSHGQIKTDLHQWGREEMKGQYANYHAFTGSPLMAVGIYMIRLQVHCVFEAMKHKNASVS